MAIRRARTLPIAIRGALTLPIATRRAPTLPACRSATTIPSICRARTAASPLSRSGMSAITKMRALPIASKGHIVPIIPGLVIPAWQRTTSRRHRWFWWLLLTFRLEVFLQVPCLLVDVLLNFCFPVPPASTMLVAQSCCLAINAIPMLLLCAWVIVYHPWAFRTLPCPRLSLVSPVRDGPASLRSLSILSIQAMPRSRGTLFALVQCCISHRSFRFCGRWRASRWTPPVRPASWRARRHHVACRVREVCKITCSERNLEVIALYAIWKL